MPLALAGSLTAVQFRCPAELSLTLSKIERFANVSTASPQKGKRANPAGDGTKTGAGNGTRTRGPKLGKPVLYQLSYARL